MSSNADLPQLGIAFAWWLNEPNCDLKTFAVVQQIRELYHLRLGEGNKEKLSKSAIALVKYVGYLADQAKAPGFAVMASLLRHLHSITKTQPDAAAFGYLSRLRKIAEDRPRDSLVERRDNLARAPSLEPPFHPHISQTRTIAGLFQSKRRSLTPLLRDTGVSQGNFSVRQNISQGCLPKLSA